MAATHSLGIDIGGTFTGLVLHDPSGERSPKVKVLTTHADPVLGILEGTHRVPAEAAVAPQEVQRVGHATTLFTNALIERKGAVIALITTAGFRGVLHVGRERRHELYGLSLRPPAPLVPPELRFEAPERVKADGTVLLPLGIAAPEVQADAAIAAGAQSIAILFLHRDLHPAHEEAAAAAPPVAGRRRIVMDGAAAEAAFQRRSALPPGFSTRGPALVEEAGSTLVLGAAGSLLRPAIGQHPRGAGMMSRLDPITLELVWTRLVSAVDEAARAILRTSPPSPSCPTRRMTSPARRPTQRGARSRRTRARSRASSARCRGRCAPRAPPCPRKHAAG